MTTPRPAHTWRFFRIGGFDQVNLTSGADLLAPDQLDQKLWVALSCPTRGLEFDAQTLDLVDSDKDGHIRVPEIIAAVKWAGRLAAFDSRAIAALNREETEYLTLAAKDLTITNGEIAGFPLSRIEPGKPLPLKEGTNPAWTGTLATLNAQATPGSRKSSAVPPMSPSTG